MAVHVCATPGCPNLAPCPVHARPSWSPGRDRAAHMREARAAKRAHPFCERCGSSDELDLHHGAHPVILCNTCHQAVDPHARRRPRRHP